MKWQILLVMTIFLSGLCVALNVEAEFDNDVIIKDISETINFSLNFTDVKPGYYNLYTYSNYILLPEEMFYMENDTVMNFTATPYGTFESGRKVFTYTIARMNSDERVEKKMIITFLELEKMIEIETNNIDVETGTVKIYVKNLEDYKIKNLTAKFSSVLFTLNKTFDLDEKETKIITVEVKDDLLKTTKAGTYVLDGIFYIKNTTKQILGKLYLNAKTDILTEEKKSGLLLRKTTITNTNKGNTVESIKIQTNKSAIARLFTSYNIEPVSSYREGFRVYYAWDYKLHPNEIYTIVVKTNYYYPILIIAGIVAICYFAVQYFKIKVDVKKKISPMRTKNGEFALRVTVHVRAKTDVTEVVLMDTIPTTVKLYKHSSSIEPDGIDVETRRLKWNIGDLKAGEERVYSYIVYSRIGYVGRFSLPRSVVKFKLNDEVKKQTSKEVFFLAEQNSVKD